ncbi:unnamed protein product [Pleuronectes platessa]|uniref:Insulin-like domain-containing protein n=1 Tax=Pleuronectes platessa TaxID=8262 RepID=A0A9N7TTB2_PLEPL|nr:unnamed protein product [Pleuronectes platessa]
MSSLLLLAMLLSVSCAAQAQTQDDANTLRLCGRAFLRAVVYTCGGSRWRRLMGGDNTLPEGIKTTDVPEMLRHRRDESQALLTVCCQLGCRRTDLSMLC